MSEEEAIKILKEINIVDFYNTYTDSTTDFSELRKYCDAIEVILNLIQKQENIIDKMAEKIDKFNSSSGLDEDCFITREYSSIDDCIKKQSCKECIKEYFNKEVEKDVKD